MFNPPAPRPYASPESNSSPGLERLVTQTRFKAINPVIPVRDMQAALLFYEGKLGFEKVRHRA
jgi:hypothetical protein